MAGARGGLEVEYRAAVDDVPFHCLARYLTMRRPLGSALLSLAVVALTARADAQRAAPAVSYPGTQQYDITATGNGQKYRLLVAVPDGYTPQDTTRYSVLYLLDGHYTFPAAIAARASMGIFKELEDVIIVGITDGDYAFERWFTSRWRDYTPTANPATDSSYARQFKMPVEQVRSGGGPAFLRAVRQDIVPFIERRYRTTGDRGLLGHSLGGLFAAYALFAAPDLFQRFGINSPSLWWRTGDTFAAESTFAATHSALPARVFLSVGAEEGKTMVPPMRQFGELLANRRYKGLTLDTVVFQGESHTSVVPAMVSRTMRVLYAKKK